MTVAAARATVSTTAVALNTASVSGQTLVIKNLDGTNGADLGGSDVTAGAGFPLPGAATPPAVTLQLAAGEILYAIRSAGADVSLAVLRTGS